MRYTPKTLGSGDGHISLEDPRSPKTKWKSKYSKERQVEVVDRRSKLEYGNSYHNYKK